MRDTLNYLFEYNTLSYDEAKKLLIKIGQNKYNSHQVSSFMTVFNMRPPTIDELRGFRDAMIEQCISLDLSDWEFIDLCGTGGDKKNTFNVSTISSFVVAAAGYKVVKHGNYGVSSNCGSSNVLEKLGYKFKTDIDKIKKEIETFGITFIHAPLFHPAMKNVAIIRRDMQVRTFFNMLGPMVNPANPNNQLIGVFSLELSRIYNYIYQMTDKSYSIVHSLDGFDEISLTSPFKLYSNMQEKILSNQYFNFNNGVSYNAIKNDDSSPEKLLINILKAKGSQDQNKVVLANSAMAIKTISGKSIEQSLSEAKDSIFSLKAFDLMKSMI